MESGARILPDGTCRFRVFAPAHPSVTLELPSRNESRPLRPEAEGYWVGVFRDIAHGERYMFRPGTGPSRPDPASLYQPEGVHFASQVWDHRAFRWTDATWRGTPPEDMVMYELHAGTFTPEGTLEAVTGKLDHLVSLGVNAIELMPVAQFPGARGWGYDGAYPYAVQASYGGPDGLKRLVDACHARGVAVILDVVYNHLGPEGTYLQEYGPYFTDHYRTPWGRALNFDGPDSGPVREFFILNALHWFRDYHIDALRLDAIHQIYDMSARSFLAELSERTEEFSRRDGRLHYLIAESDLNDTRVLRGREAGGYAMDAQWLDDFHHSVDAMLHRDKSDYRLDYGEPLQLLKAYQEGYVYSGQWSPSRRKQFGRSSASQPGKEFVVFIQNHDQVGNRLTGDRISLLSGFEANKLAAAAALLSPYIPLLFMGEEYGETNPFLFFADYGDPDLVEAVREGRKREFNHLAASGEVPDPVAESTFRASKLDWSRIATGRHRALLEYYRTLIRLRRTEPALSVPDKDGLEVSVHAHVFQLMRRRMGRSGGSISEIAAFLNFNGRPAEALLAAASGTWEKLLDSSDPEWEGPGSKAPARLQAGAGLTLGPHGAVVYRKRLE